MPTRTFQSMVEPSTDDVANMVPCGENRMHVTPYLWPVSGEYDMSTYPSPTFHSHTRTVLSLQHSLALEVVLIFSHGGHLRPVLQKAACFNDWLFDHFIGLSLFC
jgi:hypothetical protein